MRIVTIPELQRRFKIAKLSTSVRSITVVFPILFLAAQPLIPLPKNWLILLLFA